MNKLFSILLISLIMCSCGEDEPQSAPVLVNVTLNGASASPTFVQLYNYEDAKDFDKSYVGANHYGTYQELIDKQGNVIEPAYTSDSFNGVNTFPDVPNGKYIIVTFHKPDGYEYSFSYYYGYKIIDVESYLDSHFIKFVYGHYLQGYQKFVEFY